ncbi:MAG TPA: PPC domain-containing protein [Pirellulales bacterium]|nr:PPC domain-containing protein [Pirellulales bacterium]
MIEPQPDAAAVDFFSPQWAGTISLPVVSHPARVEAESNDLANPQSVEMPVTISGRISEPHDRDAFRFRLAKGQTCQCNVSSRALGYPLDSVLELLDATGRSLARSDDTNNDPDSAVTYTAPADGDYTLVVSDLYEHGGPRFLYRLTIASPEPDFSLGAPQHAFVLSAGKPLEIPVTIERKQNFAGEIDVRVTGLPEGVIAQPTKSVAGGDSAKTVKIVLTATGVAFSGPIQILGTSSDLGGRSHTAGALLTGGAHTSDLWLTVTK